MSEYPPIDELIEALMEDSNPRVRAEAARLIGEISNTLEGEDREFAKQALNRAMTDVDPTVLMAVMNAISSFPTVEVEAIDEDDLYDDTDTIPIRPESCVVCGKPMALIDGETCQFDACPYR